jgi:hypothetical protein
MNKFFIRTASAAAVVAALGSPMLAHAESNLQTGTGALTATARVDFKITIPKVLFLQVGTGTKLVTVGTINLIDFSVPVANLGDGTAIAATAASGDFGNGTVTARVFGNAGAVTLTSTTLGALSNGVAGDSISFAQIGTTSAVLASAAALPAPALADGATTTTTVAAVGKLVDRDAKWTYSYLNSALIPAGTYGGTNTNNSRVTYTASVP